MEVPFESRFFQEVGRHKLLTKEEEYDLAVRAKAGDKQARDQMVLSNMRLAIKIARDFQKKSSANLEDLIQESNVGLCKAVDLFDPEKGFKFSTYASWWMKQRVRQHILYTSGVARLPGNARQLIWKAKQETDVYKKEFGVTPTLDELANILDVSTKQLRGVLACSSHPTCLDAPVRTADGAGRLFHETIEDDMAVDPISAIDQKKIMKAIYEGLSSLTVREQIVMRLRFGLIDDLKDDPRFNESNLILGSIESSDTDQE